MERLSLHSSIWKEESRVAKASQGHGRSPHLIYGSKTQAMQLKASFYEDSVSIWKPAQFQAKVNSWKKLNNGSCLALLFVKHQPVSEKTQFIDCGTCLCCMHGIQEEFCELKDMDMVCLWISFKSNGSFS
ncbi:hypothetical protein NE237_013776 [Protea cynaroides]|uniref:Uncharacterized protein n=1 Tax=Protea cynaroides TaxID=273540 RepID=A0A9Q0H2C3_9MAGN|nr:hypothetical protein NE237_013776 [Protea cynaroides]